jgi:uncharacterized protein YeaO (DUF488 family)
MTTNCTTTDKRAKNALDQMPSSAKRISVKRVYEEPTPSDGTRVLVDRLWPRGLSKDRAALDGWLRDLAPSDELRHWYHAHPEHWPDFRKKYLRELSRPEATEALDQLYRFAHRNKRLTLLFAAKNEERNNAVVLQELLSGRRKPPSGTGPAGARTGRHRQAKRMPRPK